MTFVVLLLLSLTLASSPATAQTRDPAAAPPVEELDARSERWQRARRRGAYALLGSLAAACVIIAVVRGTGRRRR